MGLKKNQTDNRFSLELTLLNFEGKNAVFKNSDPELGTFRWPIGRLPESIQQGDVITMKIANNNEEEYSIKRKLLEELVN